MRSSDPFGTCRYCGSRIMWIRTRAGKNMPVDPTMMSYRLPEEGEKAPDKLVTPLGDVVSAFRVSGDKAEGTGYLAHFATCPNYRK